MGSRAKLYACVIANFQPPLSELTRGGWKRSREFRVKLKGIPINWRMHAGSALVSYPDPALREGKGLVTIERFLGFAESSLLRACVKDSVLIVKYGEFAESVTNDCITSCDISRK